MCGRFRETVLRVYGEWKGQQWRAVVVGRWWWRRWGWM
jgi:hypothetical protein